MRIEGNRKNHEITRGCAMKRSQAMFSYFYWKSKKTNLFASSEGCTNFCPPKNKNVPQKFSQGDKLSPSDQILAQTLMMGHGKVPVLSGCRLKRVVRKKKNVTDTYFIDITTKADIFTRKRFFSLKTLTTNYHSLEQKLPF